MELTQLTAAEAGRLIAQKEISSLELTRACIERIEERNSTIHAFRHFDPDFSLEQAQIADRQTPRSALHGVPFAVKDVIDTKDFPTEFGSAVHEGRRPKADATCVSLMRQAGSVLLGKVVTTEYAMFNPNETRHPLNVEHTPGGSSSGTAASVCDRMVPIAFGNQTAGSLIRPAAYCGVYGLKPTHGTTDGTGILPLQLYFDTLGYMARSIEDLQLFYGVVSGTDQRAIWSRDKPLKIGLCETYQWPYAGAHARAILTHSAQRFVAQDIKVERLELPESYRHLVPLHRRILYWGIARSLDADFRAAPDEMSEQLRTLLEEGQATSREEFEFAKAEADNYRRSVNECFGEFDAIICPSAPGEAPRGYATGNPIFQVSWTLLGVPCVNLPVGFGPNGLPLGVQLVGRRNDDKNLLAIAERLMRDFSPIKLQ